MNLFERLKFLTLTNNSNLELAKRQVDGKPGTWTPINQTEKPLEQYYFRNQISNELIIELDKTTKEKNLEFYEQAIKPKLIEKNISFDAWTTHSKSIHIHIFFDTDLTPNKRYSWVCELIGKEYIDKALEVGSIDDNYLKKERQLIALEHQEHYKSGKPKEMIDQNNSQALNVFQLSLPEIERITNDKRKVDYKYWDILKSKEATEQERVSCVMQIHNKHQDWNQEEIINYVCKHNAWKDFNPTITAEKIIGAWKYTKKPNPVQQEGFEFDKAIVSFKDYFEMADKFLEKQPLFYNEKKLWWAWNFDDYCWRLIDEIDILNSLNATVHGVKLFESKQRSEILSALQMRSRLQKPLDAPDTWVQFKNKIYDYKTNETFDATPQHFITNPIPFEIGENEETPTLDKWFTEWVGEKWKDTLYEIIAFSCVAHYRINRIFCFNGEGRNGKSTFLHVTRNFVGQKNCCSSSMDTIMSRTFETAKLYKKLVCEMGEINSSIFRKTELIKKLVGSDTIGFEFKGKDGFDGYNYAKILVATNKLPETTDKTTGFYSKWIIVDFNNQFEENTNFLDGLPQTEYNALAKKCLRLIKEIMDRGSFTNEGSIEEKQLRYEEKSSPFGEFMKQEIELDSTAETPFFQIYEEYLAYCEQRNQRKPSKVEVSRILKAKGFSDSVMRFTLRDGHETTVKSYLGLKLLSNEAHVPDTKDMGLNVYDSV